VAKKLRRRWLGMDISEESAELARRPVDGVTALLPGVAS
jgi:hypothetical protein